MTIVFNWIAIFFYFLMDALNKMEVTVVSAITIDLDL